MKDTGETNVRERNNLITDGAVKEVVNPQVTNLFVHPLSVAEETNARRREKASEKNSETLDGLRPNKNLFGFLAPKLHDNDKRRSRAITTAIAEAQSKTGVHSHRESTLFDHRLLGQDIPMAYVRPPVANLNLT